MKRLIGILVVLALILTVLLFAASGFVGKGIAAGVEKFGPELTKTDITLEGVDLSAFSGSGTIKGLVVGNPEPFRTQSSIKVGRAHLDMVPLSIISDKIVIEEISIDAPEITYEFGLGSSNIGQILKNIEAFTGSSEEETSSEGGRNIQIDLLKITNGEINVSGQLLQGQTLLIPLPPITIEGIGQDSEDGTSISEAMRIIFSAINAETIAAVGQSGKVVGNQLKNIGETTKESVDGLLKGLKNFVDQEKK